jgi:hypothetical protein
MKKLKFVEISFLISGITFSLIPVEHCGISKDGNNEKRCIYSSKGI